MFSFTGTKSVYPPRCHASPVQGGKYHLVGSIPPDLAYESDAPSEIFMKLLEISANSGPGVARDIAMVWGYTFNTRLYDSVEQARDLVLSRGYKFGNPTREEMEKYRKTAAKMANRIKRRGRKRQNNGV